MKTSVGNRGATTSRNVRRSRTVAFICVVLAAAVVAASDPAWVKVPSERMREMYETVKTPHKVGMVLTPEKGEMLDNPTVSLNTAIGATVVLVVAGTIAGIFPARQAAKVKPIEALRAE